MTRVTRGNSHAAVPGDANAESFAQSLLGKVDASGILHLLSLLPSEAPARGSRTKGQGSAPEAKFTTLALFRDLDTGSMPTWGMTPNSLTTSSGSPTFTVGASGFSVNRVPSRVPSLARGTEWVGFWTFTRIAFPLMRRYLTVSCHGKVALALSLWPSRLRTTAALLRRIPMT